MLDIVILCFIVKYVDRSIGFKTFRAGFSKTWALKKKIVTPFSLLYLLKKKVVCMSTWTWNYIGFGPKRSFLLGASGSFFSFKRVFPADSVVKKKKKIHLPLQEMQETRVQCGVGRSPGERHGSPLQYSCPENPMDRGAWQATTHGVAKSQTWLSNLALEKQNSKLVLKAFQPPFLDKVILPLER